MTDGRRMIEAMVKELAPNAAVVGVDETADAWRVRIAGTTSVVAQCDVPRAALEAAEVRADARRRVALLLKRCADDVVAEIPDGRG